MMNSDEFDQKTGSVKRIVNRQEVMFILDFQSDYSFDFYQNDGYILMIFLIGILQSKCSCPPRRKIFSSPEYFGELWQPEQFLFGYNHSLYTAVSNDETKLRNQPLKKNNFGLCPNEHYKEEKYFRTLTSYSS